MTKTRKNTKFAKKVSFRKLGSERREKKFRDQQFSCFEQLFLPSKPCFTLFPSPEKKTAFFGKFTFLQGIWKSKNPCFSHIFFCTFCNLPWNRPTHFLQNHVFLCFFANFFFEKKSKKITIFSKKNSELFVKKRKWPENVIFTKNDQLDFSEKFGKKCVHEKISKKTLSEKVGHFVEIHNFFLLNSSTHAFFPDLSIDENTKKPAVRTSDCRVRNFRDFVQIFYVEHMSTRK